MKITEDVMAGPTETPDESRGDTESTNLRGQTQSQLRTLVDGGLVDPQGIAVNQKASQLIVADPDLLRIFAYKLVATENTLRAIMPPTIIAENVEARWVAVDFAGNVYFSDEANNRISRLLTGNSTSGNLTMEVMFDGSYSSKVSAPGGIALDSFSTYWVNKQAGKQVGSVVKGPLPTPTSGSATTLPPLTALAANTDKSYGVCLVNGNVFYTQPDALIYGVKAASTSSGSGVATIHGLLQNPRGCAWDGDGTVFVADRGAGAVYSFSSYMQELGPTNLAKAAEFQDAFGVAVYSTSRANPAGVLGIPLLAALATMFLAIARSI